MDHIPIVEWFEAQRILGVDKVVTYPYRRNTNALKDIKYYESVWFLDIINGFYLPEVGEYCLACWFVCLVVFHTTFNNISVISWRSVLFVEESGGPRKTTDLFQVTDKLYHILLYTSSWWRFELITSVVIYADSISSCKSNCQTIRATTDESRWVLLCH